MVGFISSPIITAAATPLLIGIARKIGDRAEEMFRGRCILPKVLPDACSRAGPNGQISETQNPQSSPPGSLLP